MQTQDISDENNISVQVPNSSQYGRKYPGPGKEYVLTQMGTRSDKYSLWPEEVGSEATELHVVLATAETSDETFPQSWGSLFWNDLYNGEKNQFAWPYACCTL